MATITSKVVRNARRRGVTVYSRRQWGNKSSVYLKRRITRKHAKLPADTIWQHISVTKDDGFSPISFKSNMRELHNIGMSRFGSGVSYNFAIDMQTGEVGVGAALDAKGTHTLNNKGIENYSFDQNLVSHAICFIGMPGDKLSKRAINAAGNLIASMIDERALTVGHDYNPHSMVAEKDCPTDEVRSNMASIHKHALNSFYISSKGK